MNILLLGSGGREHAFAWKIAQSKLLSKLFIAPGNYGTSLCGTNVDINPTDFEKIKSFVVENKINMVVVGSEDPLVKGITDYFLANEELKNISVIGPGKDGAMLEGSKDFAKIFMNKYNIPTAKYKSFQKENINDAYKFLESLKSPYVLKADGLAAGKGVVIVDNIAEAKNELNEMLLKSKFSEASKTVVIEEFLKGIELSVFVLTDGNSYKILPEAKDYKRIGEGDIGLNTGGMGAVSPVPFANENFMQQVEQKIIKPTIDGLKNEKIKYKGFIFFGLINVEGNPYVIEYNCRMGDPESEVVIPRIKSDLLELFTNVANETLSKTDLMFEKKAAATVMLVSKGYPGSYEKNKIISSLDKVDGSIVFHAGTKPDNNNVLTNGGRVISVTSMDKDIKFALIKSYRNAEIINFEGKYYRKDIGKEFLYN
ncbi:MAG: phosphoribosylamine--glycine ligase [Bacteroidales bacterium]|jgi:phosphoribosylamine--glycine ligase